MEPIAAIANAVNAAIATRPAKRRSRAKTAEVRLVTINQLEKMLLSINGAKAVTILARTVVKMRKTNNPFYNMVHKTQEHNVFLNFNYGRAVNRQRTRENNTFPFVAQPRKWGVRLPYTCMVLHNDQYYMEAKVERAGDKQYTYRGRPISKDDFAEFVIAAGHPKSQALQDPVILRDFHTISILEIVLDNVRYRVKESSRRERIRQNTRRIAAAVALVRAAAQTALQLV